MVAFMFNQRSFVYKEDAFTKRRCLYKKKMPLPQTNSYIIKFWPQSGQNLIIKLFT